MDVLGRCSLYGLWGKATLGGKTLQLRALDWDTDGGLQDYPVITVYHPQDPKLGHAFTNVAWAGKIEGISVQCFIDFLCFRLHRYIDWYVFGSSGYFRNRCVLP